jgi:hypothetical protein
MAQPAERAHTGIRITAKPCFAFKKDAIKLGHFLFLPSLEAKLYKIRDRFYFLKKEEFFTEITQCRFIL